MNWLSQKVNMALKHTKIEEKSFRPVLGIYKMHTFLDMKEILAVQQRFSESKIIKKFDIKALWALFGKLTAFDIMRKNMR